MTSPDDVCAFRIAAITSRQPAYASVLAFLGEVRGCQGGIAVADGLVPDPPSVEEAARRFAEGFPLFETAVHGYDAPLFAQTASALLSILSAREGDGSTLAGLGFLASCGDEGARRILRLAASHDIPRLTEEAGSRSLNPRLMIFTARGVIKPFFWALRDRFAPLLPGKDTWEHPFCPICGNPAAIGKLQDEGGRRVLLCSLCEHEYRFPRMRCPHCGTDDQKKLHYFYPDGSERESRVALCDDCRHYLKIVDLRSLPEGEESCLPVEDVATLHLDLVARKLGFLPTSVGSFAFPLEPESNAGG